MKHNKTAKKNMNKIKDKEYNSRVQKINSVQVKYKQWDSQNIRGSEKEKEREERKRTPKTF